MQLGSLCGIGNPPVWSRDNAPVIWGQSSPENEAFCKVVPFVESYGPRSGHRLLADVQGASALTTTARQKITLLFKCFATRDVCHVQPMLKYAGSVWSPCRVDLIEKLEAVQTLLSGYG